MPSWRGHCTTCKSGPTRGLKHRRRDPGQQPTTCQHVNLLISTLASAPAPVRARQSRSAVTPVIHPLHNHHPQISTMMTTTTCSPMARKYSMLLLRPPQESSWYDCFLFHLLMIDSGISHCLHRLPTRLGSENTPEFVIVSPLPGSWRCWRRHARRVPTSRTPHTASGRVMRIAARGRSMQRTRHTKSRLTTC
jgi:hypothetical protein